MSRRALFRIPAVLFCTLVLVSIAAAHEVILAQRAKIGNGPELQPGTYKVDVARNQDSAEVSFFQKGDLVAKVPAKLTMEGSKCQNTQVHSSEINEGRVITKIWLKGSSESLVFVQEAPLLP